MFTFTFEDVSSTVAAAKERNHSAEGDVGKLASSIFYLAGSFFECSFVSFLFCFYSETMWNNASKFSCVGSLLLWREVFFFYFNRNMNMTIWRKRKHEEKKKHYAWIAPWTPSQLFVCRLNEKSIPDLRVKQKPPFFRRASLLLP